MRKTMSSKLMFSVTVPALCVLLLVSGWAASCTVPDRGIGTASIPPQGCQYTCPKDVFMIIAGLPTGSTIEMDGILKDFICTGGPCDVPGGTLGGEMHSFDATLELHCVGTGILDGFNRTLFVPVSSEWHSGPHNFGDPVQTFGMDIYQLQGELFGDPDFCTFRITAGTNFQLPSPGQMTLTEFPSGDYNVESFFDITYQIEFEGCPGSQLDGYQGTTSDTIRIQTGGEPPVCEPLQDGSGCANVDYGNQSFQCLPSKVNYNPATGVTTVLECECRNLTEECYAETEAQMLNGCTVLGNGAGTVDLPPAECQYISPDEVFEIIDGLPPGTTIELDPIWRDFSCGDIPFAGCPAPGVCEDAGGGLGGHVNCSSSMLELAVSGTGSLAGFNRSLSIPIVSQVHTGPRTPGDPVQTFPAELNYLEGELFGDPDFCTFRITAGSGFGLPSPGDMTLTDLGDGTYNVDSFFDVRYQIQFAGCPGSILDGYNGTTTAALRLRTGGTLSQPSCTGNCQTCEFCMETIVVGPNGIEISCQCLPDADLNGDGVVDLADFGIMGRQWLTTRP